jgi:hypothetical protein
MLKKDQSVEKQDPTYVRLLFFQNHDFIFQKFFLRIFLDFLTRNLIFLLVFYSPDPSVKQLFLFLFLRNIKKNKDVKK